MRTIWTFLILILVSIQVSYVSAAPADSTSSTATLASLAPTTTIVQTTIPSTLSLTVAQSSGRSSVVTAVVVEITSSFAVTYTPTPTAILSSATPTSTQPPSIHLDTKVNAAWGVAGALLILTGLPMAFWGHKNRWSSYFLVGFYTLSLTCLVLILKFGVQQEVHGPTIKLQGLFFLACVVAGVAGGGVAIFWWKGARYFVGCWGGFALALYVQCFHNGGVIRPLGFRWLFYVMLAALGFTLSTFPKIHYPVLLFSTALVGSSAFMLGVDCLSTAGLKEFYIWNLGFDNMFEPFAAAGIRYPVSQTMMIELGLIAAVAAMGVAVQLRFYQVLKKKLQEIREAEARREKEDEEKAARRFENVQRELVEWEMEHGDGTPTLGGGTPGPKDIELGMQDPTSLPKLDLGGAADAEGLSAGIVKNDPSYRPSIFASPRADPELQEKLAMLEEIRKVKQNIETLRNAPQPSTSEQHDQANVPPETQPSPTRPTRSKRPKVKEDVSQLSSTLQIPLDPEKMAWDDYTNDRKLFTPPSGESVPIPTTPIPVSAAVKEALDRRMEMERAFAIASSEEGGSGRRASRSSGKTLSRPASRLSGLMLDGEGGRRTSSGERAERRHSTSRLSTLTFEGERERKLSSGSRLDYSTQLQTSPVEEDDFTPAEKPRRASALPSSTVQPQASITRPDRYSRSRSMGNDVLLRAAQIVSGQTATNMNPAPQANQRPPTLPNANPKPMPVSASPSAAIIPRRRPVSPPPQASPFTTPQTPAELAALSSRHRLKMKAMQAPLTHEEEERNKLERAKERWEKSKSVERQVMERKDRDSKRISRQDPNAAAPEDEVIASDDRRIGERSRSPTSGLDKVLQWQKTSSSAAKPQNQRRNSRQSGRNSSAYVDEEGQLLDVDGRRGGAESPMIPVTSSTQTPVMAKRSSTSRSLDAWTLFSSPGSSKPPPN
ncbi:hypothetical protein FRB93_008780 [Tulasnella sp. JGI-2019a]|nr:hypothetical protein FRB93_008780 [Tulasnella sp. JGI-2019a]